MPSPSENSFQIQFSKPLKGARLRLIQTGEQNTKNKGPFVGKNVDWIAGYQQGVTTTEQQNKAKAQSLESAFQAAAKKLKDARDAEIKAIEPQVVDLALAICKSILHKEIDAGHYDIQAIVTEVLGKIQPSEEKLEIHLNPEDLATLQKSEGGKSTDSMQFQADPNIARASCSIKTNFGVLTREVDSLLEEVSAALTGKA